MKKNGMPRKNLDDKQFLKLRQATEKIAGILDKRLKNHLEVLKPLFIPQKLLGTYVKSASKKEIPGSDRAFAELQKQYGAICERPFGLSKKLHPPLPPISNQIESIPFQYNLTFEKSPSKTTTITSPTKYILSYLSECPLNRLRAMISGAETRQPDDMKQAIINHLTIVIFLKFFPALTQLLQDLRYEVEFRKLADLGGLPVVILTAPIDTFLPADNFIVQITQMSGIPAFQEIIDPAAAKNMSDPLRDSLKSCIV